MVSIWLGVRQKPDVSAKDDETGGLKESGMAPIVFPALVTAFMALMFITTAQLSVMIDRVFPMVVSGFACIGGLLLLARMWRNPGSAVLFADGEQRGEDAMAPHGLWPTLTWFISLLVLTAVFGFVIALALFFVIFLRLREGLSWPRIALMTGGGIGVLLVMAGALNRDFPPGLLQSLVELPWPFAGR